MISRHTVTVRGLKPVVIGLLLGVSFTLVLNAGSLQTWFQHRLTVADLGAELGSPDETYYFALIRDVRDGHPAMGNASFYEYRDAPALSGYSLLPQGLLARFTTLELATVILLGDLFYPIIITLLTFLLFRRFVIHDLAAAPLSIAYMAWWGAGWQRVMNPQVTMCVFLLALLAIITDPHGRRYWLRALTLFLLFLVQPIYAAFMIVVEGLDALREFFQMRDIRELLKSRYPVAAGLIAAVGIQMWAQYGADALTLSDTYHRRGLILSHLPAAPATQIFLLVLLVLAWWFLRMKKDPSHASNIIPILLLSGLVVLNQSIAHGRDVVFGLYYRHPISIVVWLWLIWMGSKLLRPRFQVALVFLLAVITSVQMVHVLVTVSLPKVSGESASLRSSGILEVLQILDKKPSPRIVLAPIEVSNLIPVETKQYTLFTQFAHFEYVSDQELAERYLLLDSLFPLPPIMTVEGHPLVFGIAPGNLYARNKILCKLHLKAGGCDKVLSDFIEHQETRRFIETKTVDQLALLRKYSVTTIVTDRPLPPVIAKFCTQTETIGRYVILDCHFIPVTLSKI